MPDFLTEIIKRKQTEVKKLQLRKTFRDALCREDKDMAIIAEIKRKSPSKGIIGSIQDPVALAERYAAGGAAAISVLTDGEGFGGSLQDLQNVANALPDMPLLRKDFLIDPIQIAQSLRFGASAVLLIVAVLGKNTAKMLEEARRLRIDALVEVHTQNELDIAVDAGAEIIGVNNRNLKSFKVDLMTAQTLGPRIPDTIIKVAESGIRSESDVRRMREAGFHAVLAGEALVQSDTPEALLSSMRDAGRAMR